MTSFDRLPAVMVNRPPIPLKPSSCDGEFAFQIALLFFNRSSPGI